MKCWHLVASLALAGCGLDTAALPPGSRAADAGASLGENSLAGSPASWPARRRATPLDSDGGSADTRDAAAPSSGSPGAGGQTKPGDGGQSNPAGGSSQPGKGGNAQPGNTGGSSAGTQPGADAGSSGAGSSGDAGSAADAGGGSNGGPGSGGPGSNGPGSGGPGSNGGPGNGGPGNGGPGNGGPGTGGPGNGNGGQSPSAGGPHASDPIGAIVDLVVAIVDLSLGPIRPQELETLVTTILVLSFAPADLVVDSLVAVFEALDNTRICNDDPDRCERLCKNLEDDCSVCGGDNECIERVEQMCHVSLPRHCY